MHRIGCAALLALALSACATSAPRSRAPIAIRAQDLLGLSIGEVRARFGLADAGAPSISGLREDNRGKSLVLTSRDLIGTSAPCPRGHWAVLNVDRPGLAHLSFRDGRLDHVWAGGPDGEDLGAGATVLLRCPQKSQGSPWFLLAPLTLPVVAAEALKADPEWERANRARAALRSLRLGEAPPGGLAAFAGLATVRRGDGEDATIDLRLSETARVKVEVRGGRVVSILKVRGEAPCAASEDWALIC